MVWVGPSGVAQGSSSEQNGSIVTLHTGTDLVIVDVVAQDKSGRPVHGLQKDDFILTENKVPQVIRNFEEHKGDEPVVPGAPLPPQPPGVFTDYTPVPANGVLNVLLLDTLNTPTKDQSYVRTQLKDFVKKAAPGTRIAIFGLTSKLYFLQGFTSDPVVLKEVVEHKLTTNASSLLSDPTGSNSDSTSGSSFASDAGLGPGAVLSNLQNFEAEQDAFKTRLRMEYTLDAFDTLGHYLAAFPGRKNVIWFSGSFPLDVVPDLTLANPFMVMGGDMGAQYRETTNLLTKAQVAIYPVDARGIMVDPSLDAAKSGFGTSKHPEKFAGDMSKFGDNQAQEHQTMLAIASDTGGEAFFNTNDLATAVSKAISAGSNFYTLTYTPSHHNADGEYRTIKVELSPAAHEKGLKLSFRNGYFADDSSKNGKMTETAAVKDTAPPDGHSFSYVAAAMSRGAPMPSDLLFRVRVLPASTSTEEMLAPDNKPDPKAAFKGPYRRYDIDISALPAYLSLPLQPNGHHTDKLEFLAFVYDTDGKLLNLVGKNVSLDLNPDEYKKFMDRKIAFHLEVDAPAKGESFIRIGVHDIPANTFGVVEVPTSAVVKLPPPVYPANRMQTK